jgi:hypothetical protein
VEVIEVLYLQTTWQMCDAEFMEPFYGERGTEIGD